MASPTIPVDGSAAGPVKRTRKTDVWTTVFLVLTAVLGIWSLTLIVLTLLAIAQPAFLYSDQKAALKAAGATVVGLRGAIHGFFGSTAFIAIAVKLALLKWRPSLA
jgi:hypothetical protein